MSRVDHDPGEPGDPRTGPADADLIEAVVEHAAARGDLSEIDLVDLVDDHRPAAAAASGAHAQVNDPSMYTSKSYVPSYRGASGADTVVLAPVFVRLTTFSPSPGTASSGALNSTSDPLGNIA